MVNLKSARDLASRVRLIEDKRGEDVGSHTLSGREQHRDSMLRHGVLISSSVTPELEDRLKAVCKRLLIPRNHVTAFVHNSADVQADCLVDTPDTCVLRFTSGLVNLMDESAFQFVAAHELGHFLLGHEACSQHTGEGSSEGYMIRRAQELSADRLGFLGLNNLEESVQAIIKTASGLGDQFLRFDVSSFLSQSDFISSPSQGESINSTHPSMLIRCRSLLWFSMEVKSLSELSTVTDETIRKIDKRVITDLEKFVDGQVRAKRSGLEDNIALWKTCVLIIHEGSFKKEVQERMKEKLGESKLDSLKSFFEMFTPTELPEEANKRLHQCLHESYTEFPRSSKEIEHDAFSKSYEILGR